MDTSCILVLKQAFVITRVTVLMRQRTMKEASQGGQNPSSCLDREILLEIKLCSLRNLGSGVSHIMMKLE